MSSTDSKFRLLNRLLAECQRHVERLDRADSITLQKEVSELIKSDLRSLDQEIMKVKSSAELEDKEALKMNTLNRLGEYEHQLRQLKTTSRQAILNTKKRIESSEKKNREELFGRTIKHDQEFIEQFELKQRGMHRGQQDEAILRASSDVTDALRRTTTLMQQELEKSTISATMLAESSRTLNGTYSEYQSLGDLVKISKKVISQLEASDWLDRIMLLLGLGFFCLVVLYIIKKRTWDVGISWVGWLTQKKTRQAAQRAVEKTVEQVVTQTVTALPSVVFRDEL
ncbi:Sec20-domain-containing protein [Sporodiniella umbellata]|nr:Sec20-domain-containing protein [Sporodiniella umbellata]